MSPRYPRLTCDNFLYGFKGTPSACQAGPARPVRTRRRESTEDGASWREEPCQRPDGESTGTAPTPGRAACRARPGGSPLGAAPPPGQQARTRRQAVPAATHPGAPRPREPAGPSSTRRAHRLPCERSQRPGRIAAHCPGRPLQRQGHPKILSNRSAERIFGTHP